MSLPSYIGIIISHYKDPYQPTSRMECQQGFERCSFADGFGGEMFRLFFVVW